MDAHELGGPASQPADCSSPVGFTRSGSRRPRLVPGALSDHIAATVREQLGGWLLGTANATPGGLGGAAAAATA